MSDECTCHRTKTGCLIHPQGGGANPVRKEIEENMRRLVAPQGAEEPWQTIERLTRLINEGTITKEQARQIYREEHDEEPVDATPPTDTDTPPELFRLLEGLIAHHQANLITELSRSAMKLRIQGQLEALEWVMQQIVDIRDSASTEITNEPCNTCQGRGWVVEGQSMGFPSGEQIECPDCGEPPQGMPHEHGLVPFQDGDTIIRNGRSYVRRGFAWEEVQFSGRLSQRDPSEQSVPKTWHGHQDGTLKADHRGRVFVMNNGKWVPITQNGASVPGGPLPNLPLPPWAQDLLRDETNFGPRSASLDWMGARNQFTLFHEDAAETLHDILRGWWASPQYQAGKIKLTDITES